jgi:hypothetical protein
MRAKITKVIISGIILEASARALPDHLPTADLGSDGHERAALTVSPLKRD